MMMSTDKTISQLKEAAKWSRDQEEKKTAIKELSVRGENGLTALEEILNVTVYDEIKAACLEAMKAAKDKNSGADVTAGNKKNQEKDEEKGRDSLADLPP
jgi:hypothetical protein